MDCALNGALNYRIAYLGRGDNGVGWNLGGILGEFWGEFNKMGGLPGRRPGTLGGGGWVQEGAGPPGGSPGNAEAFPGLWGVRPIKI